MLTIPCSIFKSFTKDLSLSIFELVIQHRSHSSFYEEPCRLQCYDLEPVRKQAYTYSFNIRESVNIATFQHGFWLRGVQP
jgi:hypothetical protein